MMLFRVRREDTDSVSERSNPDFMDHEEPSSPEIMPMFVESHSSAGSARAQSRDPSAQFVRHLLSTEPPEEVYRQTHSSQSYHPNHTRVVLDGILSSFHVRPSREPSTVPGPMPPSEKGISLSDLPVVPDSTRFDDTTVSENI